MDNAQLKITELIKNKKVYHEYTIEDKYDAGMALEGWEVKAIRKHRINLQDSHIVVRNQECFLIGAHITHYPQRQLTATLTQLAQENCY